LRRFLLAAACIPLNPPPHTHLPVTSPRSREWQTAMGTSSWLPRNSPIRFLTPKLLCSRLAFPLFRLHLLAFSLARSLLALFLSFSLSLFLSFCFVEISAAIQCNFWCFL
jgi:hypothetical protein